MSAPEFFHFFTYVYDIWHVCAFPGENVLHTNIKNCTQLPCIPQVHKFHLHMTHWQGPHEMAPISMVSSFGWFMYDTGSECQKNLI
jgi:hypothetical protein